MADFLSGSACPPDGFPYVPEAIPVAGGIRMTDPNGSCSSGSIPPSTTHYDFRAACATHDYGYDLLRYLELGGGRRRAVDRFFLNDMTAGCAVRIEESKKRCLTAAGLAYRAIGTSSRIRNYDVPWGAVGT
jgi:hypothetical protein